MAERSGQHDLPYEAGSRVGEVPKPRLAICVPTRGQMPAFFAYDLAQLVAFTTATLVNLEAIDITLLFGEGDEVHITRNELAETALSYGSTHLLWLDDDMRFPKDLVIRLLRHSKDFVALNYSSQRIPLHPTAYQRLEGKVYLPSGAGLHSAEAVGFGAVLTRRRVFDLVDQPWFESYYDRERGQWVREDVDFCQKARAAGVEIFVDGDLSEEVSHTGEFEYKMMHLQGQEVASGH